MGSIIYTNQRSKLSKKQRAKREALLKEQRAIRKELATMSRAPLKMESDHALASKRHRELYPSLDTGSVGTCAKRDPMKYTGDLIIGIGQMHKSNAVPILKQEDAEDIAKMRR